MAWHTPLINRLIPVSLSLPLAPPPSVEYMFDPASFGAGENGTPNYRAMAWVAEYLRSWRGGSDPAWKTPNHPDLKKWSREKVLFLFNEQKRSGFMCLGAANEQFCPDPHMNFWISAVLAARIGAKEFKHQDVFDLTTWFMQKAAAMWNAGMCPDGQVFEVGARCEGPPHTEIASIIMRELHGIKQPNLYADDSKIWGQTYYHGALLGKTLIRGGDDFGGAKNEERLPYLRVPVAVFRYNGGFVMQADEPKERQSLHDLWCSWVKVEFKSFKKDVLTFGMKWASPAPKPDVKVLKFFQSPSKKDA